MENFTIDQPVLDEERWAAWLEKGRLQDKVNAGRLRVVAGVALGAAAVAVAYLFIPGL